MQVTSSVATSPTHADDFVARAQHWAFNADALATIRSGLREQLLSTTPIDGARFARGFEQTIAQALA